MKEGMSLAFKVTKVTKDSIFISLITRLDNNKNIIQEEPGANGARSLAESKFFDLLKLLRPHWSGQALANLTEGKAQDAGAGIEKQFIENIINQFRMLLSSNPVYRNSSFLPLFLFFNKGRGALNKTWQMMEKKRRRFNRIFFNTVSKEGALANFNWISLDSILQKFETGNNFLPKVVGKPGDSLKAKEAPETGDNKKSLGEVLEKYPVNREFPFFLLRGEIFGSPKNELYQKSIVWYGDWPRYISIFWPGFDEGDLTLILKKDLKGFTLWFHNSKDFQKYIKRINEWLEGHAIWAGVSRVINGQDLERDLTGFIREHPGTDFIG